MREQLEVCGLDQIERDAHWHDQEAPGVQARFVATQYHSAFGDGVGPLSGGVAKSDTSSMNMAVSVQSFPLTGSIRSPYDSSDYEPSLVTGPSVISGSSIRTGNASLVIQNELLEEEEEGLLVVPQLEEHQPLSCSFWFLGCKDKFDDLQVWDAHCRCHFRKKKPTMAWCPFKCAWTHKASPGEDVWRKRFEHIVEEHEVQSRVVDVTSRPDTALFQHLRNCEVIDNIQLKNLREHGRIMECVFTNTERSREGRRRRDRL